MRAPGSLQVDSADHGSGAGSARLLAGSEGSGAGSGGADYFVCSWRGREQVQAQGFGVLERPAVSGDFW